MSTKHVSSPSQCNLCNGTGIVRICRRINWVTKGERQVEIDCPNCLSEEFDEDPIRFSHWEDWLAFTILQYELSVKKGYLSVPGALFRIVMRVFGFLECVGPHRMAMSLSGQRCGGYREKWIRRRKEFAELGRAALGGVVLDGQQIEEDPECLRRAVEEVVGKRRSGGRRRR